VILTAAFVQHMWDNTGGGTSRIGTDWEVVVANIGARIRKRRLALGWSLRELEARSGVDDAVISRIEHGDIAQPRLDKLNRLARALDLNVAELLVGADRFDLPPYRRYLEARYPALPIETLDRLERHFDRVTRTTREPAASKRPTRTQGRRNTQHVH
jgi:transcriptional regulator with XRE-family HTH domain